MADKRIELILQQLDELPTLPSVAIQVLDVTGRDDSSADEVVRLISSDPALTARILQLVHQADVGVRGEVNTVERAVVLLGFAALRSAILAISIFETFRPAPHAPGSAFSREQFWKHSIAVACCAELLARQMGSQVDAGEAFVCGLLHDMGKVAFDTCLPKSFAKVIEATELLRGNIADVERTVIGLDHMIVGKRLCEKWHLPVTIRECVWLHGQLPLALPAGVRNPKLVNLVTLADLLVREQHLGYSGNYSFSVGKEILADALNLTAAHLESVRGGLVAHIEPRATSLGLGQATSTELYHQALTQANKELGRVSNQLATKNRKLQIRAKFFDTLAQFQSELRPDASPNTVMRAIGQTAATALESSAVAVFSLPPQRKYAETLLVDGNGEVLQTSIVENNATTSNDATGNNQFVLAGSLASRPAAGTETRLASEPANGRSSDASREAAIIPRGGDGPVLCVGNDLEWLMASISPRLQHEQRYWIALEADGVVIGGVIWGNPPGESQRLCTQLQELTALAAGWSLALRTAQIRDEAHTLAEQLAETNRSLQTAQNEILRSRTLISVGEMAAGAAHEMNNPLAVISGRSQLLASIVTEPKHKAMAHLIFEQSHRLSQIITELMDFAKPEPAVPRVAELADLVDRALHEAKLQTEATDVNVEVTLTDVPAVTVDPKQIVAALAEVIANAIQATEDNRGSILIHGGYDAYSQRVVLTVADTGLGMDETTLRRAFDPFFSSKAAGRRRGMGLPKALRWLESSGGSIRLESRPGQGTRALVLLPAPQQAAPPEFVEARRKAQ